MSQSDGRRIVDRNLPSKLMVRVHGKWVRVDVTAWKTKIARAIDRRITRILSTATPLR